MNETNVIDFLKPEAKAPGKAKEASSPAGEMDFASQLSASSLMRFFEFNSSSFSDDFFAESTAGRVTGEKIVESRLSARDDQMLREVKERFEHGRRLSEAEKSALLETKTLRSAERRNIVADEALENKAGKVESFSRTTKEGAIDNENLKESIKELKETVSKENLNTKGAERAEQKSFKNAAAELSNAGKKLEDPVFKSSLDLKNNAAPKPTAVLEGTKGVKPIENLALNIADQLKATTALTGKSGGGLSLPKGVVAEISSPSSVSGSAVSSTTRSLVADAVAKSAPVARSTSLDSFLVRQVATKMAVIFKNNISTAKLTLTPPELGRLRVELTIEGTKVKALIAAENVMVKEVLESNLHLLKQSLQSQGLSLTEISITLSDGSTGYDKTSGFTPQGRRDGRAKGEEQGNNPALPRAQTKVDSDTLDIFI